MAVDAARKCFIHIGPHKTGTTSIQRFLSKNVDLLTERGVYFPLLKNNGSASNHNILMASRGLAPDGTIRRNGKGWSGIERVLKQGEKNILLSHETFALKIVNPITLNSIIQFIHEYNYTIHVIAYVRSQPDWLNSWYVQQQKRFYARNTFMEFVEKWVETGRADPLRYLNGLMDNPNINLEVVSFDMAVKAGLEVDFCRRLGVEPDNDWTFPARINSNVGAKTIYVAQRVMEGSEILSPNSKIHDKIKAALRTAMREHKWRQKPFMALSDDIARSIMERYEASNREFLSRYPIGSYEDVFPTRSYIQNVVDLSTISDSERQEIETVVDNILRVIKRRSERDKRMKRENRARAAAGDQRASLADLS